MWAKIVSTAFAAGLITQFITAYFYPIHVGWEIWWEVPLVIGLCISTWIVKR